MVKSPPEGYHTIHMMHFLKTDYLYKVGPRVPPDPSVISGGVRVGGRVTNRERVPSPEDGRSRQMGDGKPWSHRRPFPCLRGYLNNIMQGEVRDSLLTRVTTTIIV